MTRLLTGAIFLLPLICWAGLDQPFSTPKLWFLAALDAGIAAAYVARRPQLKLEWPWIVWLGSIALSAAVAPFVSLRALLLLVLPLPLFWVARDVERDRLMRAILWASLAESAIALLQFAGLDPMRLLGWRPEAFESARMRVYGTLGNPNFVSAWLCATLPVYFDRGVDRKLRLIGLAFQIAAIFATGSRVILLVLPIVLWMVRARKWLLAALPVGAMVLWLSPARPAGETIQGRLFLARVIAGRMLEVPLTGSGPGSFATGFANWQVDWFKNHGPNAPEKRFAGPLDHAHNDYLEFQVEYGALGVISFAGLGAWILICAWPHRRQAAAAWCGLACLAVIACVDFPFHRPAEWSLFWLLIGSIAKENHECHSLSNV